MTRDEPGPLHYGMDLHARREEVWACWTDPRRTADWLGDDGALAPVGPWDRLFDDRPRLLTLECRLDRDVSRVDVRLVPTLDGTRLEVTHHGLTGELRESVDRQWQAALERLRMGVRAEQG